MLVCGCIEVANSSMFWPTETLQFPFVGFDLIHEPHYLCPICSFNIYEFGKISAMIYRSCLMIQLCD
jgi:hypothetical protein